MTTYTPTEIANMSNTELNTLIHTQQGWYFQKLGEFKLVIGTKNRECEGWVNPVEGEHYYPFPPQYTTNPAAAHTLLTGTSLFLTSPAPGSWQVHEINYKVSPPRITLLAEAPTAARAINEAWAFRNQNLN